MTMMTEMEMERRSRGGCEKFGCNLTFWRLMLELGKTFGWKPQGAVYVVVSMKKVSEPSNLRHGYEPGGLRDAKRLDPEDAAAWADALHAARASSHLRKMTAAHRNAVVQPTEFSEASRRKADATLLFSMDEFIRYVGKGEFTFAFCEPASATVRSIRS